MQVKNILNHIEEIDLIDRETLLNNCITDRLENICKDYEKRLNHSFIYLTYRNELRTLRTLNKKVRLND